MTTRTLILMRHGKSAYPDGVADHERPLARRGQREAGLAGEWIRANLPVVDAVRCSTATRTRETLAATSINAPVAFETEIYNAAPHQIVDVIRAVEDAVATLLVIGHVPGIPWTAWDLAHNRSSPEADAISTKFPTSALAVLEFDRKWADIDLGTGELVGFHVPR